MMTANLQDVKTVSYDSRTNTTAVTLKNNRRFGWCGSKAKSNFTQIVKDLNKKATPNP